MKKILLSLFLTATGFFTHGAAKKILLPILVICGILLSGCTATATTTRSTVTTTNTNKALSVPTGTKVLPITADMIVSEQKVKGEAKGLPSDQELLIQEATAKALGQDPPTIDGADLMIAREIFTETQNGVMAVTVTGYPAWYRNFRSVTPEVSDSTWLIMFDKGTGKEKCCGGGDSPAKTSTKWFGLSSEKSQTTEASNVKDVTNVSDVNDDQSPAKKNGKTLGTIIGVILGSLLIISLL